MRQSRRAFVAGAAACWAGCVGPSAGPTSDAETDSTADRRTANVPADQPETPTCERDLPSGGLAGSGTLAPGEFTAALALTNSELACGDVVRYEVTVAGETPVDCLVFERNAWDAYVDGARDVPVVSRYSRVGVTAADVTLTLDRGQYLFAVDYTGLMTPPGAEDVAVEYTVRA